MLSGAPRELAYGQRERLVAGGDPAHGHDGRARRRDGPGHPHLAGLPAVPDRRGRAARPGPARARVVVLPAARTGGGLPALLAELRAAGATTSLDTNDDLAGRWDGLADVLAATDVFLPNAGEARAIAARLSGVRDGPLEAVAARLGALGPAVVVKDGADGALAWESGLVTRAPARPVDTVGAGDSFDAGYLAARLRGMSRRECLDVAVACGSLSTRAAGGTAAQPAWKEL
ncbi:carbohydrate kinase family protein [Actinomadura sp. ATCC 39365]